MAISDKDRLFVIDAFSAALALEALQEVKATDLEPLYVVGHDEKVVAIRIAVDPKKAPNQYTIWAIDRTAKPIVGVQVGTMNEFGQINWQLSGTGQLKEE